MKSIYIECVVLASLLSACAGTPLNPPTNPNPPGVEQGNNQNKKSEENGTGKKTPAPGPDIGKIDQREVEGQNLTDASKATLEGSVYFDYDRDEVKPQYRALLEANAEYLKQHPEARVMLIGNADDRGSREYNLSLGQRRAVSVKKVMNVYGVHDRQIETVSNGEENPVCSERSEPCHAKNRRTDISYVTE